MERRIGKRMPPNRLRELRTRSGLSQQEVADRLGGVSSAVVSRHEAGKLRLSHPAVLKYSRIYKVWSYELFHDPDEPATRRENRLRQLRGRSRLTEREAAKVLDITAEGVLAFESGKRPLGHNAIVRFSLLYKVWVYELFEEPARSDDAWDADSARYLVELEMEEQSPPGLASGPINPRDATEGPEIDVE